MQHYRYIHYQYHIYYIRFFKKIRSFHWGHLALDLGFKGYFKYRTILTHRWSNCLAGRATVCVTSPTMDALPENVSTTPDTLQGSTELLLSIIVDIAGDNPMVRDSVYSVDVLRASFESTQLQDILLSDDQTIHLVSDGGARIPSFGTFGWLLALNQELITTNHQGNARGYPIHRHYTGKIIRRPINDRIPSALHKMAPNRKQNQIDLSVVLWHCGIVAPNQVVVQRLRPAKTYTVESRIPQDGIRRRCPNGTLRNSTNAFKDPKKTRQVPNHAQKYQQRSSLDVRDAQRRSPQSSEANA
jgi:hypothetical protein